MSERPRADGYFWSGGIRSRAQIRRAGVPLQYVRHGLAPLARRHCQISKAVLEEFRLAGLLSGKAPGMAFSSDDAPYREGRPKRIPRYSRWLWFRSVTCEWIWRKRWLPALWPRLCCHNLIRAIITSIRATLSTIRRRASSDVRYSQRVQSTIISWRCTQMAVHPQFDSRLDVRLRETDCRETG